MTNLINLVEFFINIKQFWEVLFNLNSSYSYKHAPKKKKA